MFVVRASRPLAANYRWPSVTGFATVEFPIRSTSVGPPGAQHKVIMARLSKANHAAILHAADVEHRNVADIAAEHGCSPANIRALLARVRRTPEPVATGLPPSGTASVPPASGPVPDDLFAAAAKPTPAPAERSATVTTFPPPDLAKGRKPGAGAGLAKPGMGLVMRTAEGEESTAPFRSLDDLLAAIKPILRSAARGTDPVWFSIQPVDLAALDSDAA